MTTADLRKAEARYQRAFRRAEELRLERNRLVREALAAGWTHARIAEATGMSRGRVGQLATSPGDSIDDRASQTLASVSKRVPRTSRRQ